jgi:protein TonB
VVHRVKVASAEATNFVVQKAPVKYPDAARDAGTEGAVVLGVIVGDSGEVKEVTVISGNPALALAAAEAMKQWKYKPYVVDGLPAEMETEVTFNFRIRAKVEPARAPAPPLGAFRDDTYSNEYFGLSYPLSHDWIRETQLVQKKVASEAPHQGTYVLLAAVYVPQNAELSQVNSSFTLLAVDRSGSACKQYLDAGAASLQLHKEGKQKGEVGQFEVAGRDFYRGDFEYRDGVRDGSVICTVAKDYFLLWSIRGTSRNAVEKASATLNSLTAAPPTPKLESSQAPAAPPVTGPDAQPPNALPSVPQKVRVSSGVSTGLLIKKVTPVYPVEARYARIQGTVIMQAEINKTGDVMDIEALDGPLELVVSAVNAVRQWKYRPYLLLGEPVTVQTQIQVNYQLR